MYEFLVKECFNRAKSPRNVLYGRYNSYVEDLSWLEASTSAIRKISFQNSGALNKKNRSEIAFR